MCRDIFLSFLFLFSLISLSRALRCDQVDLEIGGQSVNSTNDENCNDSASPQYSCQAGYTGDKCDVMSDICIATQPCKNDGICTKLSNNDHKCDCTVAYKGANCQDENSSWSSARFEGNGYIELNRTTIANEISQVSNGIALMFSTNQSNGLIFWHGQNKGHAFNGEDFLALAVKDGFLKFTFRLDGEESFIRHNDSRVDNNDRHIAILKRLGNQASLELDGLTEYDETRATVRKEMKLTVHIFLGGAPDLRRFTGDRFCNGFIGCIHIVESIEGDAIRFGEHSISHANVKE